MPWSDLAVLAGIALVAALVSAAGSAWAIRYAHGNGLLDAPGQRRSHTVETPRGGGIGIVLASLLAIVAISMHAGVPSSWWLIAAGLLLVAGIGWMDDHRALPALPRLGVHALAALLLAAALYLLGAGTAICALAFILALGMTNAWNFMDGINGLAASQAFLCALAVAMLAAFDAPSLGIAVAVAGACLGFLPFNFPRARVFLGDVGSGALGYLVAVLVALGFHATPLNDWPLLLLPPLAILIDSGLTLLLRVRRGERWWQAHAQHAYQQLSRRVGHARVTLGYGLWTITVIGVMLSLQGRLGRPGWVGLMALLFCALAATLAWGWLRRYAGDSKG
ncbi:MAG: lipopolysaccharide biosynthesis protein [Thermomonas sp.]